MLFFLATSCLAIDFSRVNVAWQYDVNAELKISHRIVQKNGIISVFLKLEADSLPIWDYEFLLQNGYDAKNHRVIAPTLIDTLMAVKNHVVIKIQLSKIDEPLFLLKVFNAEKIYFYDIPLKTGTLPFPNIYASDHEGLPIFENYINQPWVKWKGNTSFYVMQYKETFALADPPMAKMKPLYPISEIDTSFIFSDSVVFLNNYFYVVRADSNASVGVTMLRTPSHFPKPRQLGTLLESLFYITSETERKSLINSKNIKQAFDSFWLNNFNTKSRARNAIRKYYDRVEVANILFTDFKPGWKTDRGMIYIVLGRPDEVFRTGNLEKWYYNSWGAFEFSIISSFFAPRTYSLRRSSDLGGAWHQYIAAIRLEIDE